MDKPRLIAVPVEEDLGLDSRVCPHFGHTPAFALVELDGDQVLSCRVVKNPMANNHQPGMLPGFVRSLGADVLLAGGMGPRAIELLESYGIEVATGADGSVRDCIEAYQAQGLRGAAPCDHGGDCGGHHHNGGIS